jgi:hypothetical protein
MAAATSGGIGGSHAVRANDALPRIAMLATNLEIFIYLILLENRVYTKVVARLKNQPRHHLVLWRN